MTMDRAVKRTSKSSYRNLPIIIFGCITAAGCLFIAVTKLLGVHPAISMTIPILLMLTYWTSSWYLRRARLHDEQTGDNLYYMGFLFTLSSLGVSLYQFTSEGSMDDVVRNFGIAITSTIFGIAFRILYNQTRRDVVDIEQTTRMDLATMTRQVRAEMESARREFADFRRVNTQMMSEGFDEVFATAEETTKKVQISIEKMAEDAVRPLQDASKAFTGSVENSIGGLSAKLEGLTKALEGSIAKIETTASKFEGVKLPDDLIKTDLVPMVKEMSKVYTDLATRTEAANREQVAQAKAFTENVNKLMGLVERSNQASAAILQKIEVNNAVIRDALTRVLQGNRPVSGLQLNVPVPPPISPVQPRPGFQASGTVTPVQAVHQSPSPPDAGKYQFTRLTTAPPVSGNGSQNGTPKSTDQKPSSDDDKWTSWYKK